ncbi:armadillo-type protein, partial [Mycena vulgaris]
RVVRNATQALHWIASVPQGAQDALDKDVLQHVMELFKSPQDVVRKWACAVVGQLSSHETTLPVVLAVKLCTQLVSLLSDESLVAAESAVAALYVISRSPEGAQAVVDAHVLDCVAKLLESPSILVCRWTCKMLAELAQTLAAVVFRVKPCKQLATLLRVEDLVVVESAVYALSFLTNSPEGARDVVDAHLSGAIIDKLLTSPSSVVQTRTCLMLGNLAAQKTTSTAVLGEICERLVKILQLTDLLSAVSALARISEHPGGIAAIVDADVQTNWNLHWHILHLTESLDPEMQVQSCIISRNLANHILGRSHSTAIHPTK